ncbi:GtrA family protein [Blastococcus sp. BMG 814]|uniref:GtrA family protein n=1 Tax=Blastococcus carthaginiensis TaxID=3050034 RepID=A0ABT9IB75_9ACTN|nr:GtrA family protein [Blastococcus carthaginiensis]MDP5182826.1 GtrA family protein [Blastococcus carthaginiensis]
MAPLAQLRRLLRDGPGRLVRELGAFGVVGAVCFLVDVGLFQLLYAQVGLGAVTSKLLASLVSMSLAFVGHRFWSFSDRARTGLRREYALFLLVNAAALLLGLAVIGFVRYPLGQEGALVLQGANLLSIALGTVVRFLAYRRYVFVAEASPTPARPPVAEEVR